MEDSESPAPAAALGLQVALYRAAVRSECAERAFMLAAVGIDARIGFEGSDYMLYVDVSQAPSALEQLRRYEAERRQPPPPPPKPPLPVRPHAWVGALIYAAVLIGVGLAVSQGWWRLDAFHVGELDAGRIQAGQWWRACTALTLHLDTEHLLANLFGGIWFGLLASRQLGAGHAWLLTLIGASVANLIEGLAGPADHLSVGASTAVFTALGLQSAHAWRAQYSRAQRWGLRWAPLVSGVVLLGWFGAGTGESGDTTDVVAHALGFLVGVPLGALAAWPRVARLLERVPQWLSGLVALLLLAAAWGAALAS